MNLIKAEKLRVALSSGVPLSVTRTVNLLVEGPCASVGVQEKTPSAVMAAPAGAPGSRLNFSC
jgi:hypothetical protein